MIGLSRTIVLSLLVTSAIHPASAGALAPFADIPALHDQTQNPVKVS